MARSIAAPATFATMSRRLGVRWARNSAWPDSIARVVSSASGATSPPAAVGAAAQCAASTY